MGTSKFYYFHLLEKDLHGIKLFQAIRITCLLVEITWKRKCLLVEFLSVLGTSCSCDADLLVALYARYSQDLEEHKRELRQVAKHPISHQEEDGGSNLSQVSPTEPRSREVMRQEPVSEQDRIRGRVEGSKGVAFASDNTTITMSDVSSNGSGWPFSSHHHTASTAPGDHGNSTALTSPQEMTFSITLGEDLPDSTVMDNLTYSSFSESILPMGPAHGYHDSAWSQPRGLKRLGEQAAAGRGGEQSAGSPGMIGMALYPLNQLLCVRSCS